MRAAAVTLEVYMLWIEFLGTSYENALGRISPNPIGEKSTFIQVMCWCRQPMFTQISVAI